MSQMTYQNMLIWDDNHSEIHQRSSLQAIMKLQRGGNYLQGNGWLWTLKRYWEITHAGFKETYMFVG